MNENSEIENCFYHQNTESKRICYFCGVHICNKRVRRFQFGENLRARDICDLCFFDKKISKAKREPKYIITKIILGLITILFFYFMMNAIFVEIGTPSNDLSTSTVVILIFLFFGFPFVTFLLVFIYYSKKGETLESWVKQKREFIDSLDSPNIDEINNRKDKYAFGGIANVYCFNCGIEVDLSFDKCPKCGDDFEDEKEIYRV